jgi:hypothetical protein
MYGVSHRPLSRIPTYIVAGFSLQAESAAREAPLVRFLLRGTTHEVTTVSGDPFSISGKRYQMWYIRRNTGGWRSGGVCKIIAPEGSLGPRNQDAVRLDLDLIAPGKVNF